MAEQTIRVEIYNQTYSIRSDGDNEYILDLAGYVDSKMREISSGTLTVDSLKVAILAALHIADEFYQLKNTQAQIRRSTGCQKLGMLCDARPHFETQGRGTAGDPY